MRDTSKTIHVHKLPAPSPPTQATRTRGQRSGSSRRTCCLPLGGLPPTLIQTCSGKALFLLPKVCLVDSISC